MFFLSLIVLKFNVLFHFVLLLFQNIFLSFILCRNWTVLNAVKSDNFSVFDLTKRMGVFTVISSGNCSDSLNLYRAWIVHLYAFPQTSVQFCKLKISESTRKYETILCPRCICFFMTESLWEMRNIICAWFEVSNSFYHQWSLLKCV